jgi:hypothetical protein
MLERFFEREPGLRPYEWDDFEHTSFADPRLEAWRQRILTEIGPLVAPTAPQNWAVANDRVTRIIAALQKDKNASNQ